MKLKVPAKTWFTDSAIKSFEGRYEVRILGRQRDPLDNFFKGSLPLAVVTIEREPKCSWAGFLRATTNLIGAAPTMARASRRCPEDRRAGPASRSREGRARCSVAGSGRPLMNAAPNTPTDPRTGPWRVQSSVWHKGTGSTYVATVPADRKQRPALVARVYLTHPDGECDAARAVLATLAAQFFTVSPAPGAATSNSATSRLPAIRVAHGLAG